MSNTNTGGPAFPYENRYEHEGMTLRDYFAAKAMQGVIASLQEGEDFTDRGCEWAYQIADAMLKARQA
jgi:hypothetical protein